MADPQTVNLLLSIPVRGSNVGTWDVPVNGDFNALDGVLAGVQAVSASNAPITLTSPTGTPAPSGGPTQAQNAVLRFSGTLTANVQVTLPLPGYIIIENLTTGAFVLSFRAIASGEVIGVEQGSCQHVYNDGTNVRFVNLPNVGTYLDVCDATVPAWIAACTKPPYLNCDGSTFNATTYPYLNSKLGGNTLPDIRGVGRVSLNQGTGRITTAVSGIDGNTRFSLLTSQTRNIGQTHLPNVNFTVIQTPHVHTVNEAQVSSTSGTQGGTGGPNAVTAISQIPVSSQPANAAITVNSGGSGTGFSSVGPSVVSGITLIRAA